MTAPAPEVGEDDEVVFGELRRRCRSGDGLAPLLGDDDGPLVEGRRQMSPWLVGRDCFALLGWIGRLERCPAVWASAVADGTQLSVLGVLDGQPVELVGITHRPVPGGQGPLDLDALLQVARAELTEWGLPC